MVRGRDRVEQSTGPLTAARRQADFRRRQRLNDGAHHRKGRREMRRDGCRASSPCGSWEAARCGGGGDYNSGAVRLGAVELAVRPGGHGAGTAVSSLLQLGHGSAPAPHHAVSFDGQAARWRAEGRASGKAGAGGSSWAQREEKGCSGVAKVAVL
ncbi:hypothetical protein E2562_027740 [Oryza meyeriana var. granulata]|uniref:Uncharacterized protein n=1 Tax=Oryza meyeriana var. granulata TaxID=110450 RepID=A0A6G1EQH5_9ORYZ|nr:hypothetical protein E2562_027740 [Oryza meyeriana var. granulata]